MASSIDCSHEIFVRPAYFSPSILHSVLVHEC
jgi:hypothetical protein